MKRAIALLALCVGCVDSVGPFVRDVTVRPNGSVAIVRCDVELHRGFIVGYSLEMGECHTEIKK